MTLEINEIGIRMQVRGAEGGDQPVLQAEGPGLLDREQVISDCVRRVLQALKALEER